MSKTRRQQIARKAAVSRAANRRRAVWTGTVGKAHEFRVRVLPTRTGFSVHIGRA